MTLISASELAAIQGLGQSGMSSVATILTRIVVETVDGQESQWATVGDDVVCWIKQITGDASTLGAVSGAVGISQLVNIRFPVGTAVASGDQIAVGSTIYMAEAANDSDSYPNWLEMACRVIQ